MRRALGALALLGALAATPAHAAHSLRIGIADDGVLLSGAPSAAATVAKWKALGVDVARLHVRWIAVAPAPHARHMPAGFHPADPSDPHYNWGAVDRAVGLLLRNGIAPILSVTGSGPLWSSQAPRYGNPRYRPSPSRFGDFATAVARRYAIFADEYIVWNEPNQPGWLQPQFSCRGRRCRPAAPHVYRRLFESADKAIHRADPGAQVYAGALAPRGSAPHARNAAMRPLTFLRAFGCVSRRIRPLRHGDCAGFRAPRVDGIAYHPHGVLRSPSQHDPQRDEAALGDLGRLETLLDRLQAHHRLLCSCHGHIPLHLTEYGYQTDPPDPYQGVSLAHQARWLQEAGYRAWRDPRVKTLVQYEWRDDKVRDLGSGIRAYSGWQSGLLFADGRAKPALAAFANPFWIDARPRRAGATVWGQVRPGTAHSVRLLRRLPGRSWRSLGTLATDAFGSFTARVSLPAAAQYRFAYDEPVLGALRPRTVQSPPLAVRRARGVVPAG